MKKGDVLSFIYKTNRIVKGEVKSINHRVVLLLLYTDYKGKNVFWEEGEYKEFNLSEMKQVKILNKRTKSD